ncbi:hypothetical protein AsAng_0005910 [Aureispira anguillae]|uniref:Uncharacterized protein n=1 Tax=Aureispira anguillae TaxID=2864201 RepID=A0A915YB83_9BACT|nr:hypothetical protein AsAng_0005910 [Aureispira anguillae]
MVNGYFMNTPKLKVSVHFFRRGNVQQKKQKNKSFLQKAL